MNSILWQYDGKDARILDVCELATRIGLSNWYDPRLYHHGKIALTPSTYLTTAEYLSDYTKQSLVLQKNV